MTTATRVPPPAGTEGHWFGTDIDVAIDDFSAASMRASSVDAVTTQVVRLRCARYHDCRLCQSLRLAPALDQGLDEVLAAKVDRYESSDLAPHHRAALALTDAVIIDPRLVGDALRARVREHFIDEQLAELLHNIGAALPAGGAGADLTSTDRSNG